MSAIKADFTDVRPLRCSGHTSNIDNWFNPKDVNLALYDLQQQDDCSPSHLTMEKITRS